MSLFRQLSLPHEPGVEHPRRTGVGVGVDAGALLAQAEALVAELEATHARLAEEARGRAREAQAGAQNTVRLARLGGVLQSSETREGVEEQLMQRLPEIFPGLGGAIYTGSHGTFHLRRAWGGPECPATVRTPECWGLRLRVPHVVPAGMAAMACPHVPSPGARSICVPLEGYGQEAGLLLLVDPSSPETGEGLLGRVTRQLATAVGEQIGSALANIDLRTQLQVWALRDPLSGLYNRRFIDEWIDREISRSSRSGRTLGIVMIDVDHFKSVNDTYGHDAGDALLKALGGLLENAGRAGDVPSRYGGEEFLLLLPDIDLETLVRRVDDLRVRISQMSVSHRGRLLPPVTVSAGVAVFPRHGTTAAEVLQAADAAVYLAKRTGRNRACTPPGQQ